MQNCSSRREDALFSLKFEPPHVGCYGVLHEAPEPPLFCAHFTSRLLSAVLWTGRVSILGLPAVVAAGVSSCADRAPQLPFAPTVTSHSAATRSHTNRLAREKSPYLLQHQHNPVDWFAWGEEAFRKARKENKPIFLSIGYSTCHWCHVMERESFESEEVARFLNAHFVSIKVDREERPDVDKIYMTFVQASSGQGGWPLNCFLTPELKPFYGGTYFGPDDRHGRPSFLQVLQSVERAWATRHGEIVESAEQVRKQLEQFTAREASSALVLTRRVVQDAGRKLMEGYDPRHGGFGRAPKFPQPSQPQFLLRYARRCHDDEATRGVLHTCERMAAGGIYDHLGGGFARYSVDERWLVPHFEKMLYDNAQLTQLYLDAFLVSGERRFADVARGILRYVLRDMTHPDGGFYSAEDADSEGKEGKFYCWTRTEMAGLLSPEEFNVAVSYFGVTEAGNFVDHSDPEPLPNQNVLSIVNPNVPSAEGPLLQSAMEKMSAARAQRVRPHLDDKVLASWNGLMLGALARASVVLGEESYRAAAEKNLAFLRQNLWESDPQSAIRNPQSAFPQGTLYHRWRDGGRDAVQLLEAYAFLLGGVIDLYEATLEPAHLEFAVALAESMLAKFYDPQDGGFWQSAAGATDLILRVKEDYDGAEPSGNSVATLSLLRLAAITERKDFRQAAEKTLRLFAERLQQLPQAVPCLLQALDFSLEEPRRVVIAGDPKSGLACDLLRAAHRVFQPNKVVLGTSGAVEPFARSLKEREGQPTAYVCLGTSCLEPTSDAAKLAELLK
ncbi:MAG: thioredoxin domain-containing protein [Verrucomicrobia bacterium]|nr:thioredoxin domain-containing protein [Verrucomicrobiota bacterium]